MAALPAPLKAACTTGDLSHAKTLYNDLVATDASAKTATLFQMSIVSAENDQPSILAFCFSEGLKLNPEAVNDPLIFAAGDSGSIAIFRVLLDNGMPVDNWLEIGGSPLVLACRNGNVELARFLLDQGADPNTDYQFGEMVGLVWAIVGSNASLNMVELLLARGTKVKGTGALIAAADEGNLGAVKLLLQHGEKTGDLGLEEVVEYDGYDDRQLDRLGTALYKAAAQGHVDVVDTLIQGGADSSFKDRTGRAVVDIAREKGHENIVRRLGG